MRKVRTAPAPVSSRWLTIVASQSVREAAERHRAWLAEQRGMPVSLSDAIRDAILNSSA